MYNNANCSGKPVNMEWLEYGCYCGYDISCPVAIGDSGTVSIDKCKKSQCSADWNILNFTIDKSEGVCIVYGNRSVLYDCGLPFSGAEALIPVALSIFVAFLVILF